MFEYTLQNYFHTLFPSLCDTVWKLLQEPQSAWWLVQFAWWSKIDLSHDGYTLYVGAIDVHESNTKF